MCGIAGILSFDEGRPELSDWVRKMTDTIRHRGPDDEGFVFFEKDETICSGGTDTPAGVWQSDFPYSPRKTEQGSLSTAALGHRRLSIIDPGATGHQPMCDHSGRFWLVFNGEIYNYLELQQELISLGHAFITDCDTEVIIQAYIRWGRKCVEKFNGMWAFGLYDKQEKVLFCSRDRFGVKPFYYFRDNRLFAFASEQKALVSLPFFDKKLNEHAVFDYLVLGQTELEPEGFFKRIFELPPSNNLIVKDGQIHLETYYCLPADLSDSDFSITRSAQYVTEIKHLLQDAVKLRLRSDVPVGACLSGGIDSSSLVCLAVKQRNGAEPFHVFTSVFPGKEADESGWAEIVVKATNSDWHRIETRPEELLSQYEDIIYNQDIPFFGSSTLSQAKVMQLISQTGIKVTLDGQGADELFSGYPPHFFTYAYNELAQFRLRGLQDLNRVQKNAFPYFLKFLLKKASTHLSPAAGYRLMKKSKYDFRLLNQDFWQQNQERYLALRPQFPSNLNSLLYSEYYGPGLKYLMRTADRNSMRYSVESRVPFADDHRLAEKVFSIPGVYKMHQGRSKYLLRESMKETLPLAIYNRVDKKGFATPELEWFRKYRNELKSQLSDNLEPFVQSRELLKQWDHIFASQLEGNTLGISRFLILSLWRKRFGI